MSTDVPAHRSDTNALVAAIFASGMAFIDGTVVNVATPKLQSIFVTTASEVQWIVEAYALTLSAFLLIGGTLGDIHGRKRIFICGNLLFGMSSFLCGTADSLVSLVLARATQGLAAAMLIPGSLSLITFSHSPAARARAIGIWSGITAMMGAIGPFLGGWFIDHLSWRAAFFINIPMAALAVLFSWRLEESRGSATQRSVNWAGAASMAAGLATLTYSLLGAQDKTICAMFSAAMSVAFFMVFIICERRATTPLFPLSLLNSSVFMGMNVITLLLYAALFGAMYFLPVKLIEIDHYTALEAGAAPAPMILSLFVLSPWTAGLLARYGARLSLTARCCIVSAGLFGIAISGSGGNYWSTFFIPMLVLGLGMSVCVSPLTTSVMNSAPEDVLGVASGINNAVSRLAGLLAVAIFGLILSVSFGYHLDLTMHSLKLTHETIAEIERQKPLLASARYAEPSIQLAVETSFVDSFRIVIRCSAVLAFFSAVCAWRMLKTERTD